MSEISRREVLGALASGPFLVGHVPNEKYPKPGRYIFRVTAQDGKPVTSLIEFQDVREGDLLIIVDFLRDGECHFIESVFATSPAKEHHSGYQYFEFGYAPECCIGMAVSVGEVSFCCDGGFYRT